MMIVAGSSGPEARRLIGRVPGVKLMMQPMSRRPLFAERPEHQETPPLQSTQQAVNRRLPGHVDATADTHSARRHKVNNPLTGAVNSSLTARC
jgi:hypothetical protein